MATTDITRAKDDGTRASNNGGPAPLAADAVSDGFGLSIRAGVTALIIDDHQLFADVIRATLEGEGIRVLEVAVTAGGGLGNGFRGGPPPGFGGNRPPP